MTKLFALALLSLSLLAQGDLTIKQIMSKPDMWGTRVQQFAFSPDGKTLFIKERQKNIRAYSLATGEETELNEKIRSIPRTWINNTTFLLREGGKYYDATLDLSSKEFVYDTKSFGTSGRGASFTASKNHGSDIILAGNRLIATRNGRLSTFELESDEHGFYVQALSESGRFVLINRYKRREARSRDLYFPNYLPKFTDAGKQSRGINKSDLILIDLEKTTQHVIYSQKEGGYIAGATFNGDSHLAFIDRPVDRQTTGVYLRDLISNAKTKLVYKAKSDKWVVGSYHRVSFSPNGKKMLFVSLSSGFERLFTHTISSGKNKTVTTGNYEVNYAEWLDNNTIVMVTNDVNPTERRVQTVNVNSLKRSTLSTPAGYIEKTQLSSDKKYLAYEYSSIGTPPDLYVYSLEKQVQKKLSSTVPDEFLKQNFAKHEIIKTKSSDKKFDIYANFYSSDKSRKPLVVFVHGAGILQNVRNGWTPAYHREYLFHQILIKKGYHVLDVDYRGSKGYSNRFATDVYSHLGKKELEDIVSFIEKLDKDGLIDKERVGIYGGSYGGFMAAYAMQFQPDLFKAGAALRSVFKWENYFYTNEWYTRARLGLLEDNPEWYKRSSPVYHADKIKHPMLILHGMLDDNVPFQDAVQMVQEMIDHEKTFDLMIYPKEKHSFRLPKSWTDEYLRIYNYFETYLKAK